MGPVKGLILSVLFITVSTAQAFSTPQPLDQDKLVRCMLDHTTPGDETVFKNLMIAALSDDTGGVKSSLVQMSSLLMNLALTKCEVAMSMLADPQFQAAAKIYGQHMGEKLMKKAFEKLN